MTVLSEGAYRKDYVILNLLLVRLRYKGHSAGGHVLYMIERYSTNCFIRSCYTFSL